METNVITASLGSTSDIKADALKMGLEMAGIEGIRAYYPVESGMPLQPEGEQTRIGAMNRALRVRRINPHGYSFGIENGIRQERDEVVDFGVVYLIAPDGRTVVEESLAVPLPKIAVEDARKIGFDKVTVGKVMADVLGTIPDDPHLFITGGRASRSQILAKAVKKALERIMGNGKPDFLHVDFCGVERMLPVREVSPGLSVALFNPLGDWQLVEEAGEWLATKIPSGTEVLLMPDGKAQALLHVMGRVSGLPTVVARKELKPYMAAPAIEAEAKSVTTDKVQRLFLGADDAARLRGKRVAFVDDVVSSGGTLKALRELLAKAGAIENGVLAVFTEGGTRSDVIAFGNLPLFKD